MRTTPAQSQAGIRFDVHLAVPAQNPEHLLHGESFDGVRLVSLDPETGPESEPVTMTVTNARPVASKSLFALVDVEMRIAGVVFEILGVQARRTPNGTAVELPAVRDAGGTWRPAIRLPQEGV